MEYLQKTVNPVLEPLVIDLLSQRPKNVPEFIHDWIEKKYLQKDKQPKEAELGADTVKEGKLDAEFMKIIENASHAKQVFFDNYIMKI